jgi:flagellar protein FlbT
MTLKLSLKPGEKFVLNGAVLINGDKATSFLVENQVTVLRDRDMMQADAADTAGKRVYLAILNLYVGEGDAEAQYEDFVTQMAAFMSDVTDGETLRTCVAISRDVLQRQYYKALIKCRQFFDFERSGTGLVENAA